MKTVGFIGAYDKTDLILYISKILAAMGKRVLVIDNTILQKIRYVIPNISPAKAYVTSFEEIDFAVGFYNYSAIKAYIGMPEHATFDYDYIFVDTDSAEGLENFELKDAAINYFVTNFSVYSLKKGLEILAGINEPMPLTKVLFSKNITKEEDEYLNFISIGAKAVWNEEKIYFPFEQGDQTIIMENQRMSKVKLKKLTTLYKESLYYIADEIIGEQRESANLRKAFKQLEKGV